MFGSVVLEVAGGLVLTFLLFSIILTSLQEGIEAFLKGRAKYLEQAIGELLDQQNTETRKNNLAAFFNHPLIFPLFSGAYQPASHNLPSYIHKTNFATAVQDLVANKTITSTQLTAAMDIANKVTGGVATDVQKWLEDWYDSAMERVSGRYQRNTRLWLFGIGLAAAIGGNINTIDIATALSTSQQLRENMAALAPEIQQNLVIGDNSKICKKDDKKCESSSPAAEMLKKELTDVKLPVGWHEAPVFCNPLCTKGCAISTAQHFSGWLITALAGLLGAPFWFDLLNKFMNFRSSIKPDEDKKK